MQNEVLRCRLAAAYNFFAQRGHQHNMNRVRDLAEKLVAGEYGIAFAGHFSAGKCDFLRFQAEFGIDKRPFRRYTPRAL